MTKDKITLPPLPECDAYCGDCNQGEPMWTEEQMIAYAESAVVYAQRQQYVSFPLGVTRPTVEEVTRKWQK
jgi:hypothetical protein